MASARLDDIVSLAFFARVVEAGSFKGAADLLGVSRPAVSQRIAALEKRCGVRLFHRSTRKVALTLEGERVYAGCAGLTKAADEITPELDRLGDVPRGRLRVSAPVGFGSTLLMPVLPASPRNSSRFPSISVHGAVRRSRRRRGRRRYPPRAGAAGLVVVGFRKLGTERMVMCAAPSYLEKHGAAAQSRRAAPPRLPRARYVAQGVELQRGRRAPHHHDGGAAARRQRDGPPRRGGDGPGARDAAALDRGAGHREGRLVMVLEAHGTDMHVWALFPTANTWLARARAFLQHLAQSLRGGPLG